jgi:hypothetical protein
MLRRMDSNKWIYRSVSPPGYLCWVAQAVHIVYAIQREAQRPEHKYDGEYARTLATDSCRRARHHVVDAPTQ